MPDEESRYSLSQSPRGTTIPAQKPSHVDAGLRPGRGTSGVPVGSIQDRELDIYRRPNRDGIPLLAVSTIEVPTSASADVMPQAALVFQTPLTGQTKPFTREVYTLAEHTQVSTEGYRK